MCPDKCPSTFPLHWGFRVLKQVSSPLGMQPAFTRQQDSFKRPSGCVGIFFQAKNKKRGFKTYPQFLQILACFPLEPKNIVFIRDFSSAVFPFCTLPPNPLCSSLEWMNVNLEGFVCYCQLFVWCRHTHSFLCCLWSLPFSPRRIHLIQPPRHLDSNSICEHASSAAVAPDGFWPLCCNFWPAD